MSEELVVADKAAEDGNLNMAEMASDGNIHHDAVGNDSFEVSSTVEDSAPAPYSKGNIAPAVKVDVDIKVLNEVESSEAQALVNIDADGPRSAPDVEIQLADETVSGHVELTNQVEVTEQTKVADVKMMVDDVEIADQALINDHPTADQSNAEMRDEIDGNEAIAVATPHVAVADHIDAVMASPSTSNSAAGRRQRQSALKRGALLAFAEEEDEFRGFTSIESYDLSGYRRAIERLEEQGRIANIASQNYLRNIQPSNNVNAANIANHANRNRSNAANRGNAGNRTNASNRGRPRNHVNAAQIAAIDRELENAALAANLENAANQACVENAVNEANESANLANADNNVAGPSQAPPRAAVDGDGSRPSSAQSARSDDIPDGGGPAAAAVAPRGGGGRGRERERELLSPLLRVPMERGWRRELVYRATFDSQHRRNADIYYYTPQGKKLRSTREVSEQLEGTGLTLDNFSFFKEPLGIADPEKETIRDAKMNRRVESPVPAPPVAPPIIEGKRTPKPKAPKGASPEPSTPKSPSAKIKVKSVGSRLAVNSPSTALTKKSPTVAKKSSENHNAGGWKRPRVGKIRGRVLNGSPSPSAGGTAPAPVSAPAPAPASASAVSPPRKRGRPKSVEVDYITAFFNKAHGLKYNVVIQIFQYLGMRDLGHCSRVCKQWHQIAGTPALWRHVRLKNSFVSDWAALCALLRSRGTKWLDMKKMLVPPNDTHFWDQFSMHIGSVESLERLELCRCPARAVEAALRALPRVVAFSALAIRDMAFDPGALAHAPRLRDLRIKSMAGLTLAGPLAPLADLTHLVHLSLTSIKFSAQELECNVVDVIGHLRQLESLELGECTFHAEFAGVVSRLRRLRRLRLERGTEQCAAPALLHALSNLPMLSALELINVDVKVGFDDALAECTNIERLLIIPTYVSQSATTNKQVLSGVLRLKDSLTHLMWGVTIELLRVTELFIDQCEQGMDGRRRDIGECIPVLKPVPGCRLPDQRHVTGPPQVEIMPLPTLQRLLSAQLPNTKLKLLRIPFHATWRQSLADFH